MTAKIKLIQKSYILSFLLLLIIMMSQLVEIPYSQIILLTDASLLFIVSILQLIEFIKIKKLLVRTSDILSQGNERDFSVLNEKEKNIISYKITNLIEQLEDSVNQSHNILDEKEKLEAEVNNYRRTINNIQESLNRDVITVKSQILQFIDVIDRIILDFSKLENSHKNGEEQIQSLLTTYSSYEESYSIINQSIEKSRKISDREINRSEDLMEALSGLYDKSEDNEEQLTTIFKGIDNIRDVTEIINNVAEKASILSLNAAIESAHAGEAGKGFAVVAEEVGVLASTTAEHAENINEALYSVTDLISDNTNSEKIDLNSYPDLINNAKEINNSFIKIRELLNFISLLKKPEPVEMSDQRSIDRKIIGNCIQTLSSMKGDVEKSIENIGQLVLLRASSSDKENKISRMRIHETSLKPVDGEIPLDL